MEKYLGILLIMILGLVSCESHSDDEKMETWKAEIMNVEEEFNNMTQKEGLPEAFKFYAANDGVIRRKGKIIKGKDSILQWYKEDVKPNETLTWKPTFIDVSKSGDMAYTFGNYIFTYPDSLGNMKTNTGIFHTVWKRQADGSWRYVWD